MEKDNTMYAFSQIGEMMLKQVVGHIGESQADSSRFMQCLLCQRKAECAEKETQPKDNPRTGMCSRLLLEGETRSFGETRGRKKGKKIKKDENTTGR